MGDELPCNTISSFLAADLFVRYKCGGVRVPRRFRNPTRTFYFLFFFRPVPAAYTLPGRAINDRSAARLTVQASLLLAALLIGWPRLDSSGGTRDFLVIDCLRLVASGAR